FQAKLRLFTELATGTKAGTPARSIRRAIVNVDDPRGHLVCGTAAAPVWTYSVERESDLRAEDVELSLSGTRFTAVTPCGRLPIESRLVGVHNVYNILAAIGVGLQEGIDPERVREGVRRLENVPGRFERVEAGQPFTVVVDYAHTDDALVRLLTAAQGLKTGRLITVFGCGGDRDRGKRPKMGRVAASLSDVVILTSDNPRTEDPLVILREVEVGVRDALDAARTRYEMIPDRREAIEAAVRAAHPGDMVVIAGKGHEDYQILGTTRIHFDDREVARDAIRRKGSIL
ncbi:MAG: Mur ligase family protein, partial [Nitrospirales bacterium]